MTNHIWLAAIGLKWEMASKQEDGRYGEAGISKKRTVAVSPSSSSGSRSGKRLPRPSWILSPVGGASGEEGNLGPSDHDQNQLVNGDAGDAGRSTHANQTPGEGDRWLRSVEENSSEIVSIVDPDGTLRYANPAWQRALGYDLDEAIGKMNVLDHVHERVIERIPLTEGVSGRTVCTGRPILIEDVRSDSDFLGAVEDITSEICVPLFDEGETVGFINVESRFGARLTQKDLELMVALGEHVGVALSRARFDTQVRRNEERLRSLADSAFEGILISDEGEILEANRALTDMVGYEVAELVGRSALEFVAPEHRNLVRGKIASGAEDPYEIVGLRKDGTLLDLEVRGRAFSYRGRKVRVTVVRDITERKAAEMALREECYRTLVEQILAVTFIDWAWGSKEPVYDSPQVEGMLGYTPEEWMDGRLRRERLHPDDRERILASDERFDADGEEVDEEYRLLAKDGSVVWVRE